MVLNTNDHIATDLDPGRRAYCAVKEERERYVATLTLAVDRNAKAAEEVRHRPPPLPAGPLFPGNVGFWFWLKNAAL